MTFFCKLFERWIVPKRFKDKISLRKIKFWNKLCELREIWYNSQVFIDWLKSQTVWFFWASYLIYEVLKYINSLKRLDQFAKNLSFSSKLIELWSFEVDKNFKVLKLRFLYKLFQLWSFSIFPSCFFDEIGSRFFFHARYVSLKSWENSISSILNRFAKNFNFLRKLLKLWK